MPSWTNARKLQAAELFEGGASVEEIARQMGSSTSAVSWALRGAGVSKKRVAESAAGAPPSRAERFRQAEDAYMEMARAGVPEPQIAATLGLSATARGNFRSYFFALTSGNASDSSCPRFAEHEAHVGDVLNAGGFPRAVLDERGRAEWLGPDGKRWGRLAHTRAVKRRRAA